MPNYAMISLLLPHIFLPMLCLPVEPIEPTLDFPEQTILYIKQK
jgi:hypothetical protein